MRFRGAVSVLALAAGTGAALLSCAEPLEPLRQETATGTLEITVVTEGAEPDANGYLITVDTASAGWASNSTEIIRSTVPAGSLLVQVTDLAANCSAQGENPRNVTVQPGTTMTVSFVVVCRSTGVIQFQVTTTGEKLDADGYLLTLDRGLVRVTVGMNSQHEFKGLAKGPHTLELGGIAANCRAREGNSAQVEVTDQPATIGFSVECFPGLFFRQLSGGYTHTCGVTTDDLAYCWGRNIFAELGDGTFEQRTTPVAVKGGLRFRQVASGSGHSCGLTTDHKAYCWGLGYAGQLGDGTFSHVNPEPVAVLGGHNFSQLSAKEHHTCGLTTENRLYCWGDNTWGQLGVGPLGSQATPTAVLGDRTYRSMSAGSHHTCAVTTAYEALCWGRNEGGQIGDDSDARFRLEPVPVAGGRLFLQISAGWVHTCAVTILNRAFCWGSSWAGQVGDGKTLARYSPRAVAGGLSFSRVSTGYLHSCGETTSNQAYCWGGNSIGQLGDGTNIDRLTPVAVIAGLSFAQLTTGAFHTCGTTPESLGYCWGDGYAGELGNGKSGDQARSTTPVAILLP